MTLEEIYRSSPDFRASLDAAVKTDLMKIVLSAVDGDIVSKINKDPIVRQGQSFAEAVSYGHAYLQGMRDAVHIIRTIGQDQKKFEQPKAETPYEHAIAESLLPQNWGKYPFEAALKSHIK